MKQLIWVVFLLLSVAVASCLAPRDNALVEEYKPKPTPQIYVQIPTPAPLPTPENKSACEIENERLKDELDSLRQREWINYCECDPDYYD